MRNVPFFVGAFLGTHDTTLHRVEHNVVSYTQHNLPPLHVQNALELQEIVAPDGELAVAIAYPDLVHVFAGTALMQTGQAVEILGITMACYLSLSLFISLLMNWYNRAIALKEK